MKKKYKGYFKKPTRTLVDVKYRKFTEAMCRTVGKQVCKIYK